MQNQYDVIIVGGSYAGLSAAMSLGRSLRKVLVIDSGLPCNRQTPHSHNFITQDGETPAAISAKAKAQVLQYPTVQIINDTATSAVKKETSFEVATQNGTTFTAKKILFATGVKDILPDIDGIAECWGISVVHCPYCHGYEYRDKATGILANGDAAYHYAMLVSNLTNDLAIYTNGKKEFTESQLEKLAANNIPVYEDLVKSINHSNGNINTIALQDGNKYNLSALYTRPGNSQHCSLPQELGCTVNEQGYIVTDVMQKTNIPGIYAGGDCCSPMRSVSNSVAQGAMAGAAINAELCSEAF
jgi:thioredoxin reductase